MQRLLDMCRDYALAGLIVYGTLGVITGIMMFANDRAVAAKVPAPWWVPGVIGYGDGMFAWIALWMCAVVGLLSALVLLCLYAFRAWMAMPR